MANEETGIIIYDDKVRLAAAITASSTLSGYPVERTKDERIDTYWQPYSGASNRTIIIDLGTAQECDACAILGHNLYSVGQISCSLKVGSTDDGVTFDTTCVSINTDTQEDFEPHVAGLFSASYTKRYWRFLFYASADRYKIGALMLGTYYEFPTAPAAPWPVDGEQQSERSQAIGGASGRVDLGPAFDSMDVRWPLATDAHRKAIQLIKRAQGGGAHPVAYVSHNDRKDDRRYQCAYCTVEDLRVAQLKQADRFSMGLSLQGVV